MIKSNQSHHLYGFTDLKSLNERGPLVIKSGKGIYVYDIHNGAAYNELNQFNELEEVLYVPIR